MKLEKLSPDPYSKPWSWIRIRIKRLWFGNPAHRAQNYCKISLDVFGKFGRYGTVPYLVLDLLFSVSGYEFVFF